jgi:IS5 family transposase
VVEIVVKNCRKSYLGGIKSGKMLGKTTPDLQQNLFKTRLTELINMEHPLVKLAQEISWDKMEAAFANLFSEGGRPSIAVRKIAGMLLLKEMFM